MTKAPAFHTITESPRTRASAEQMAMLYTRYLLAAQHAKGGAVLEVACGAGVGLGLLAASAKSVIGIDIDPENCAIAMATYSGRDSIQVRQLDAAALPFAAGSFNLIVLFEAIYYLPQQEKFLRDAARLLAPGGTLLISTVNPEWTAFNASPFSTQYYSASRLQAALQDNGFEVQLLAGFPEPQEGIRTTVVRNLKIGAVKLGLIPKTMKGKEVLKRLVFGKLTTIPREMTARVAAGEPLVPIERISSLASHKMLYAIGRRPSRKEE